MKLFTLLIILLCLNAVKTSAQGSFCPPTNIGFEKGDFTGWACDTGSVDPMGVVQLISSSPINDRQTIYNATTYPELDPFGNFPTLCPYGGGYSIRLGNPKPGKGAERISYTFTVPNGAAQYDLIFYYAVVLQNPPHQSFQQPRFTVKTFDVTDNTYIECASFDFVASASLPGFQVAPHADTVFYKDWSPSTIHLQGFAGKQMRLEFTTNDCTLGRHFGYAYLDVNEDCGALITGNTYCGNQKSMTMLAPGGFGIYSWYTPDFSQLLSSAQALTISPPPPDGTKYAVVLTPFNGLGCTDTLTTIVKRNDADLVFNVPDTLRGCVGGSVDLTAKSVTAGSTKNLLLSYYTDKYGLNYLYKPESILTSGTYYIKAISPEGCITIAPVNVVIANPVLNVEDPTPVTFPVTVDLSLTFNFNSSYTYKYFSDAAESREVVDYQHVAHSGTYYIEAANSTGCTTTKPVNVVVSPPPPPTIKAANTFTPNNDGINDYFNLTITGYGKFESLKVYNRFGQLMFESKSQDNQWDGKFNDRPANVGTYYWVFEGKNTYYNTEVTEAGFITLIR